MINVKKFVFNFIEVNTYLVYDETNEAVLIDCGCLHTEEEEELCNFITKNKLKVKHLLNTHLHLDHAFGNAFASETFGIKPEGDMLEETRLPDLQQQADRFGIPLKKESVTLGNYLKNNDLVAFGNSSLQCLSVPGHSPGSLAFYSKEGKCVFTGDALFQGSIGRTDLWEGDFNTLINSIQKQLLVLPDETIVYPGHGPATTIGEEKKHNMYLR